MGWGKGKQTLRLGSLAALMLWGCGRSPTALPIGSDRPAWIKTSVVSAPLSVHPFSYNASSSLNLLSSGQIDFHDAVLGVVQEQMMNPYVHVVASEVNTGSTTGSRRYNVGFQLGDTQLVGHQVAATLTGDGSPLMIGDMPNLSTNAVVTASKHWPADADMQRQARSALIAPGAIGAVTFGASRQVYVAVSPDSVHPALRSIATVNGMPYEVVADSDTTYSAQPYYFQDTTGSAQIDANNVNDKLMITYQLKGLVGDGTLHNQYLQTYVPSGVTQAVQTNEIFNFPATDERFDEVMAFAHTDSHFNWMLGLGGQTYGDLPIHILLHQQPGGTTNNALFMPGDADSGTPFQIILGDGDGQVLQNLSTDSDVPSHESGHYMIYNYLKQTSGESLAVHEGLADLLVYLQKNNACLGPTICPAGTTACIEPGCLRTADNNYAYNDINWQEWTEQLGGVCCGHKHGQVLGGVVWDLVKNGTFAATDGSNLTMKAISYFQQSSGIRDFLLALLTADKELFQCKYDTQLRTSMQARNLTTLIADVAAGCASLPALSGTSQLGALISATPTPSASSSSSGGSSSDSRKGIFSCGAVATTVAASGPGLLWMLVGLPLLVAFASSRGPRRRAVLAKARRR